jgi:hypothetical protein
MKEILEAFGFTYQGLCKVCGGNAQLYVKDKYTCKIFPNKMRFKLIVNNNQIVGKANDLEKAILTYCKA